jgi:hypothetical protein
MTGLGLHHGLPPTPALIIGTGFDGHTTVSTWAGESSSSPKTATCWKATCPRRAGLNTDVLVDRGPQ